MGYPLLWVLGPLSPPSAPSTSPGKSWTLPLTTRDPPPTPSPPSLTHRVRTAGHATRGHPSGPPRAGRSAVQGPLGLRHCSRHDTSRNRDPPLCRQRPCPSFQPRPVPKSPMQKSGTATCDHAPSCPAVSPAGRAAVLASRVPRSPLGSSPCLGQVLGSPPADLRLPPSDVVLDSGSL